MLFLLMQNGACEMCTSPRLFVQLDVLLAGQKTLPLYCCTDNFACARIKSNPRCGTFAVNLQMRMSMTCREEVIQRCRAISFSRRLGLVAYAIVDDLRCGATAQ